MKHHIIVKWNTSVPDKAAWMEKAREAFTDAMNLPGVTKCEFIPSNSDRDNRYDLMIRMELTPEGLKAWDASDAHKAWKENYSQYIEKKAIFDCD